MADFPLTCNVQGDYGYKVVVVDDEDTIAEVIRKAANEVVGVLVAPFPENSPLHARIHGSDTPLPEDQTVKQVKLLQMEAIDIYLGA